MASAQDYSQMPTAVQQKMDNNKIIGVPTYSGVFSTYEIELSGLQETEKQKLTHSLSKDIHIQSYDLAPNGKKLIVKAEGEYSIKNVKTHVAKTTATIEKYSSIYSTTLK